ncbi:hypothetical protein ES703_123079 [subsurface metagenome]
MIEDSPTASETPTASIFSSSTPIDSSADTSTDMASNALTVLPSPTPSGSPTVTPTYIPPTITDTPKPTRTKKPLPPPPTNTPDLDLTAPTVSNPSKVGVTVGCMVTFKATVTDESEVVAVEIWWGKNASPTNMVNMSLYSGSTTNGEWRGTFSVNGFTSSDQLRVYVRAYDWLDSDADGLQDDIEPGVKDVKVELFSSAETLVATTTTNADGQYTFDFPSVGDYYLRFTPPSGFFFTRQDEGEDNEIDSDVDPRNSQTVVFSLGVDETNHTLDAGLLTADFGDPPTNTPTSSPTYTPSPTLTSTPTPTNTPTPFMGGESTHTLRGTFGGGVGGCGYAASFSDTLIVSIEGDQVTFRQPSTGDVNTGTINPDGSFKAMRADGHESYEGQFKDDWSGVAINKYTDSSGCTTTYDVVFTPQ